MYRQNDFVSFLERQLRYIECRTDEVPPRELYMKDNFTSVSVFCTHQFHTPLRMQSLNANINSNFFYKKQCDF